MSWRGTPDEAIVYSAAAIVVEQAGCSTDDAIDKIRDRAAAVSRTVPDTARLIVAGVVRFDA